MLGPRVLASQTWVLFCLYGAAGRQVHAFDEMAVEVSVGFVFSVA
jgi:hypothetical protein